MSVGELAIRGIANVNIRGRLGTMRSKLCHGGVLLDMPAYQNDLSSKGSSQIHFATR